MESLSIEANAGRLTSARSSRDPTKSARREPKRGFEGFGSDTEFTPVTVFVVGSGVSKAAGLPLFREIRSSLDAVLPAGAASRLGLLSPEAMFSVLGQAGIEVEDHLRWIFNQVGAVPNAAHRTCAQRLAGGDVVWTTNYDTLIEDAARSIGLSASQTYSRLRKPHGTFVRGDDGQWSASRDLLFTRTGLRVAWDEETSAQLSDDFNGQPVVIVGYTALDISVLKPFGTALQRAKSVVWIEQDPELQARSRQRYRFVGDAAFVLAQDACVEFVARYGADGIEPAGAVRSDPTEYRFERLQETVLLPRVQTAIALATGETERARRTLVSSAETLVANWKACAKFFIREPFFSWTRPLLWSVALRMPYWFPLPDRVRARSVSGGGVPDEVDPDRHLERLANWERVISQPESKIRVSIARSRCLRELGRYREAIDVVEDKIGAALDANLPTEAAWAQFEVIEAARTLGDFDLVDQHLRLRLESIAMVHWIPWFEYQRCCLALQRGDLNEAEPHLRAAEDFWWDLRGDTQYRPEPGHFYSGVARAALLRCTGHGDESIAKLEQVRKEQPPLEPLLEGIWNFHCADALRVDGAFDRAAAYYRAITVGYETHGALQALGLALVDLAVGTDPSVHLERAVDLFVNHRSRFGADLCRAAIQAMSLPSDHTGMLLSELRHLAPSTAKIILGPTEPIPFA